MTQHNGTGIAGQPDLATIAEHYGTTLERKSQTELVGAHPQHGSSTGNKFQRQRRKDSGTAGGMVRVVMRWR